MYKLATVVFGCAITAIGVNALAADEKPVKIWSGDVELGYVSISGNSKETSTKGLLNVNRRKDIWLYNIHLESLNTKSNNERSAEKYFFSNRLGREFSKTDYIFAYASYDEDHFSGFDYQSTVALGWGHRFIDGEAMQWDLEAGPGYRISKVEDDSVSEDSEEAIVRVATKFSWDFSPTAKFTQVVNVETGADNTISKSDSALRVKINGHLSMKLFYSIKYTDEVPVGTKHADTETGVTLSYSF